MAKSKAAKVEVNDFEVAGSGFGSGFGICHLAACVAILLVICCCFSSVCGGF